MQWEKLYKWVDPRVEQFPLVDPHRLTQRKYPHGIGATLKVEDKIELKQFFDDPEMVQGLQALILTYGIIVFRCLDDKPFELHVRQKQADRADPNYSIPFHVDIDTRNFSYDDYVKWEKWTWGAQGLYQQPTKMGRTQDTLIAPRQAVAANMNVTTDQFNYFLSEAERMGMPHRSKWTPMDMARIMSWLRYSFYLKQEGSEGQRFSFELANQWIFANTPQVFRMPWADPHYAQGGSLVLWDGGYRQSKRPPLMHARDNKGSQLAAEKENLWRF